MGAGLNECCGQTMNPVPDLPAGVAHCWECPGCGRMVGALISGGADLRRREARWEARWRDHLRTVLRQQPGRR